MPRLPAGIALSGQTRTTVEDIVSSTVDTENVSASQPDILLDYIAEHYAPPPLNGTALQSQLLTANRLLPTGCPSIDGILKGGFREGHLTEICGESGSGKTQLCLMTAAATASRGDQVVYIDTANAVSGNRLITMLQHIEARTVPTETAFESIKVAKVHSIHQLLSYLDTLLALPPPPANSNNNPSPPQQQQQPKILIIDSLGSLMAPAISGTQHSQGQALLSITASTLKLVARRLRAAVVVTNHLVGGGGYTSSRDGGDGSGGRFKAEKRPSMGENWQNQPHVRLRLAASLTEEGTWVARVVPCAQVTRSVDVLFKIAAGGLIAAG